MADTESARATPPRNLRLLSEEELAQRRPILLAGIDQFNDGYFFQAHETLEELWLVSPQGIGTGVIIDTEGHIIFNDHVIRAGAGVASTITVTLSGGLTGSSNPFGTTSPMSPKRKPLPIASSRTTFDASTCPGSVWSHMRLAS